MVVGISGLWHAARELLNVASTNGTDRSAVTLTPSVLERQAQEWCSSPDAWNAALSNTPPALRVCPCFKACYVLELLRAYQVRCSSLSGSQHPLATSDAEQGGGAGTTGTVRVIDRDLHSRMPLSFTPLLRLKCCHACEQRHSSRVFAPLTGWHCKFRPTKHERCHGPKQSR
jgi:hypothetical protein